LLASYSRWLHTTEWSDTLAIIAKGKSKCVHPDEVKLSFADKLFCNDLLDKIKHGESSELWIRQRFIEYTNKFLLKISAAGQALSKVESKILSIWQGTPAWSDFLQGRTGL